jgi:hypothetical protein
MNKAGYNSRPYSFNACVKCHYYFTIESYYYYSAILFGEAPFLIFRFLQ